MAERTYAKINPDVLAWARRTAGLDLAVAARKAQVPADKLEKWEAGESRPTIPQIRKLGRVYKRPISIFYLPEAPRDFAPMHDYRRIPGDAGPRQSPELRYELRRALERREVALELYEEIEGGVPQFDLHLDLDESIESAGRKVRESLLGGRSHQRAKTTREAFNDWRTTAEDAGILVFQMTDIELSESRGFSVSEELLPIVAVNWKDSYGGRIFSLFHEVAHIGLRRGGLCDYDDYTRRNPEDLRIEVYCNAVAAAGVIPREKLLAHPVVERHTNKAAWHDDEIEEVATSFGVSREALVRRLVELGRASKAFYRRKREQYQSEWQAYRERQRRRQRESGGRGGPSPSITAVSSAGSGFTRLVLSGYYQDRITASDVANIMEVRLKHLDRLDRISWGREKR